MDSSGKSMSELRRNVIEKLKFHYAHGNLEEEEFDRLISEATNATERQALVPIDSMFTAVPADQREDSFDDTKSRHQPDPAIQRKKQGRLFTLLGGTERKGKWNVPKQLNITTILGGAELNMAQCDFNNEDTVINLFCMLGGVELIVPDDIEVVVEGIPILGGFEDSTQGHASGGPRILIRGFVMLGGAEIRNLSRRERRKLKKN